MRARSTVVARRRAAWSGRRESNPRMQLGNRFGGYYLSMTYSDYSLFILLPGGLNETNPWTVFGFSIAAREVLLPSEEREFAVLIDSNNEADALRWMKPGVGQFRIEYANGQSYEPDFVVETQSQKLIVEIKAANEMDDPIVQAKTRAATKWVDRANAHAQEDRSKPWAYVLVPHDVVLPSATLKGLLARHILTGEGAKPVTSGTVR
jgi:hypothetical protein